MMGSFLKVMNFPKLIDSLSQLFFVKTVVVCVKGSKDHGVEFELIVKIVSPVVNHPVSTAIAPSIHLSYGICSLLHFEITVSISILGIELLQQVCEKALGLFTKLTIIEIAMTIDKIREKCMELVRTESVSLPLIDIFRHLVVEVHYLA